MASGSSQPEESVATEVLRVIIGAPKQVKDPNIFHKMSLIPVLAWIGLGADGLSSSSYGPEEVYRALGTHTYLAILLGLATALTVFIISYAYSPGSSNISLMAAGAYRRHPYAG